MNFTKFSNLLRFFAIGTLIISLLNSCTMPLVPANSCSDGIKNYEEEDIDCGGGCTACPTCNDGLKNGDEVDVDCGGSFCAACGTPACTLPLNIITVQTKDTTYTIKTTSMTYTNYYVKLVGGSEAIMNVNVSGWGNGTPNSAEYRFVLIPSYSSLYPLHATNLSLTLTSKGQQSKIYDMPSQIAYSSGLFVFDNRINKKEIYACGVKLINEKDTINLSFRHKF